jgi:hypothetical protein
MNEVADAQRNLFSVYPQYTAACDHRVHLFLIVGSVIVLQPLPARSQLELIDAKTGDAELLRQRAEDPVRRLHLADVDYLG